MGISKGRRTYGWLVAVPVAWWFVAAGLLRVAVPTDGCFSLTPPKCEFARCRSLRLEAMASAQIPNFGSTVLRNYCFPEGVSFFVAAHLPLAAYKKMMGFFDSAAPLAI